MTRAQRRRNRQPEPAFKIELDGEDYQPGDRVTGRLRARKALDGRPVDLHLELQEQVKPYEHVKRRSEAVEIAGPMAAGEEAEFTLELPADAPPNLEATHGSVKWRVAARRGRGRGEAAYRVVPVRAARPR